MSNSIRLISTSNISHVSLNTINEFEFCIIEDHEVMRINNKINFFSKLLFRYELLNSFYIKSQKVNNLAILMGCDFQKCVPYFGKKDINSVYLFDAWPSTYEYIIKAINKLKIENIFFSSFQAYDYFNKIDINCDCYWIPEGIKKETYKFSEYSKKDIDIIQMGRKYKDYHYQIVDSLKSKNRTYLFENKDGEIIFPSQQSFVDGLSRSKISICVPANITHPEKASGISTMTQRYLQSMLSKNLIVGYAPFEMKYLFDYDPMIKIDERDPIGQLEFILNNYENFIPLIERNYNYVVENHTWQKRWSKMKKIISQ